MINYLAKKFKLKIEDIDFDGRDYPRYTILDSTRNIFGYIIIEDLSSYSNDDYIQLNNKFIIRTKISFSQLERPIFYILIYGEKENFVISSEEVQEVLLHEGSIVNMLHSKINLVHMEEYFTHIKKIIK